MHTTCAPDITTPWKELNIFTFISNSFQDNNTEQDLNLDPQKLQYIFTDGSVEK